MAIQDKSLASAEHDWYATRSGEPANAPLTQHKFGYFASKSIASAVLTQMEREWLQTLTGVTSTNPADMWREAVAGQSLTPTGSIEGDKFLFFTSVATSP